MADGDYERPRTAELARLKRLLAEARARAAASASVRQVQSPE